MAWETRRGRGRYYTRSRRVQGRVVRQYVGRGLVAELAAAKDTLSRVERQIAAEAARAARQRHEELTAPLDELCRLTDLLLGAALVSAGFHQHDRGTWRRRRHGTEPIETPGPQDVSTGAPGAAGEG